MGDTKIIYLYCLAGERLPCVLKVFFGDIMHEERGHGVLLGKRHRKIIAFNVTGEKTYRGENV